MSICSAGFVIPAASYTAWAHSTPARTRTVSRPGNVPNSLRIAEASGNSALALVVRTLWDQRTGPLFLRLEHHFDTPELWTVAIREHRDVVHAIARRDAAGARTAMRRHMNQAARRFSTSWEQRKRRA